MQQQVRSLPVRLSNEERTARGLELAGRCRDVEATDEERKAVATKYRQSLKDVRADVKRLYEIVRTGEEYRTVEVERVEDAARLAVVLKRKDTGEVIEERAMTVEERQQALFPNEQKDAGAKVNGHANGAVRHRKAKPKVDEELDGEEHQAGDAA